MNNMELLGKLTIPNELKEMFPISAGSVETKKERD